MPCGACINGSTAPLRGATNMASGGAGTTSTTRDERRRRPGLLRGLGAELRPERGGHGRLVRIDVGDGYADAWRLDDVHGLDADARSDVDARRRIIPGDVGRDDGGDDA